MDGSTWPKFDRTRLCGRRDYDERELDVFPTYLILK